MNTNLMKNKRSQTQKILEQSIDVNRKKESRTRQPSIGRKELVQLSISSSSS